MGTDAYFSYFMTNDIRYLKYYVGIDTISAMLIGPVVYFYTLSITTGKVHSNLQSLKYLTPILPNIIFETYLILLPANERVDYLVGNFNHLHPATIALNMWLYFNLIFYYSLSVMTLNKSRGQLSPDKISAYNEKTSWLRTISIYTLALLIALIPFSIISDKGSSHMIAGLVLSNLQFFYILMTAFKNSFMFPSGSGSLVSKEKYATSLLSSTQVDHIYDKSINCLDQKKLFADKELTLGQLAKEVNISTQYLSQVINTKSGSNFPDFINWYRIEESKKLLLSPGSSKYTIEAIALESGFGTKMSFNKAFKKFTGETPSEYRRSE